MVYILVMLTLFSGGNVESERVTVIFPNQTLCEAALAGIHAKLGTMRDVLDDRGVDRILMRCVRAKEA